METKVTEVNTKVVNNAAAIAQNTIDVKTVSDEVKETEKNSNKEQ